MAGLAWWLSWFDMVWLASPCSPGLELSVELVQLVWRADCSVAPSAEHKYCSANYFVKPALQHSLTAHIPSVQTQPWAFSRPLSSMWAPEERWERCIWTRLLAAVRSRTGAGFNVVLTGLHSLYSCYPCLVWGLNSKANCIWQPELQSNICRRYINTQGRNKQIDPFFCPRLCKIFTLGVITNYKSIVFK